MIHGTPALVPREILGVPPPGVTPAKMLLFSNIRFLLTAKYSIQMGYGQIPLSKRVNAVHRKSPGSAGAFSSSMFHFSETEQTTMPRKNDFILFVMCWLAKQGA